MLVLPMVLGASGCTPRTVTEARATVPPLASQPIESGHAPIRGISMYYEVHGRGDGVPLVLLHGGGSTIESTFS